MKTREPTEDPLIHNCKISIGMPVYNGEPFVYYAIDSLLRQTHTNFELIISNNCSTDSTREICLSFARNDPRIKYFEQRTNFGAAKNFNFVKTIAEGDFFMWAAADDRWEEGFIASCLQTLNKYPRAIGAITETQFGTETSPDAGSRPLTSTLKFLRRYRFLLDPGPNTRFYSLFRASALAEIDFAKYDFHAGDWAFIFDILSKGQLYKNFAYLGLYKHDGGLGSNRLAAIEHLRSNSKWKVIPLEMLIRHIFRKHPIAGLVYLPALLLLNVKHHKYLYR